MKKSIYVASVIGLLVGLLGVALIVVVLLYNAWQDWRARRSMRQSLPEAGHDVLMRDAAPRREPGLWPAGRSVADESPEADPACEAVIDIALAHPVAGETLAEALRAISRVGKKPVRVFAEREGGGHRAEALPGEAYVSLQLAVVLALNEHAAPFLPIVVFDFPTHLLKCSDQIGVNELGFYQKAFENAFQLRWQKVMGILNGANQVAGLKI